MKNRFPFFLCLFLLGTLLSSCTNTDTAPHRFAELEVGMTLQQLTSLLGKPRTINNQGALAVYEYVFTQPPPTVSYYVVVGRDGRVRSFGPN